MPETSIEWATHVWNPFTGCDRVSPGCANCYAAAAAASLKAREQGRIDKAADEGRDRPKVRYQVDGDPKSSGPGFGFTVHWDKLQSPERFPAGARVFVNSMSDVFHEEASDGAIAELFGAAAAQPQANFLILTKRARRMQALLSREEFWETVNGFCLAHGAESPVRRSTLCLPNIWLGVSIENRRFVHRADLLRQTPAAVRFISAEPLLGPLVMDEQTDGCGHPSTGGPCWFDGADLPELSLEAIDWLIVGGESGTGHRPILKQWVDDLLRDCLAQRYDRDGFDVDLPGPRFFFKQWGGTRAKAGGRELDGRTWSEMPAGLPVAGSC